MKRLISALLVLTVFVSGISVVSAEVLNRLTNIPPTQREEFRHRTRAEALRA